MLYRRFERLIDPFRSASERMPPSEVLRFYVYFLRQVWPVFLALLVVGLIVALIEVALFSYLAASSISPRARPARNSSACTPTN